jgi:hypothetical protein
MDSDNVSAAEMTYPKSALYFYLLERNVLLTTIVPTGLPDGHWIQVCKK